MPPQYVNYSAGPLYYQAEVSPNRYYQASACARRRISVLRPSVGASMGPTGRDSSLVWPRDGFFIAKSESFGTTRGCPRDSRTREPFLEVCGYLAHVGFRVAQLDRAYRQKSGCVAGITFRSRACTVRG